MKTKILLVFSAFLFFSDAKAACEFVSPQNEGMSVIVKESNCGEGLFCFATVKCDNGKQEAVACKALPNRSRTGKPNACPEASECLAASNASRIALPYDKADAEVEEPSLPSPRIEGRISKPR